MAKKKLPQSRFKNDPQSIKLRGAWLKSTGLLKRSKIGLGRKKRKKMKNDPVWSRRRADAQFSAQIRARDNKCLHPDPDHRGGLQNSHYISRARHNVRFDEENCIALCWWHHFQSKDLGWEYQKQTKEQHGFDGQYTIFMKNLLGEEGFKRLQKHAEVPLSLKKAIEQYQLRYTALGYSELK